jgi:hypothetical protein
VNIEELCRFNINIFSKIENLTLKFKGLLYLNPITPQQTGHHHTKNSPHSYNLENSNKKSEIKDLLISI